MVYGPAWPLVHEWRGLWDVDPRDSDLSELERVERIRELEVAMLEEHGLTLPPETEPLQGPLAQLPVGLEKEGPQPPPPGPGQERAAQVGAHGSSPWGCGGDSPRHGPT